jgi:tetratricopeptide (TPR) repeat protein
MLSASQSTGAHDGRQGPHEMKKTIILLAIPLWLASIPAIPAPRPQPPESDPIHQIKRLEDDVKEIRRDQLNYQIERDLLKEAYATNLKTVDVLITIGLGVITIVGFVLGSLGVRNIYALRKEYKDDLDALRQLKAGFEGDIEKIKTRETETKDQFTNLNNRIHVLELQEKAGQFIVARNFVRGLSYAELGLSVAPDDPIFLTQKGICQFKTRDYTGAIQTYELMLKANILLGQTSNLAELYLVVKRLEDFDKLLSATTSFYPDQGTEREFRNYLAAVRAFVANDADTLKKTVEKHVTLGTPGQSKRIAQWDFEDVKYAIQQYPDTPEKNLLLSYISVLNGQAPIESLKPPA